MKLRELVLVCGIVFGLAVVLRGEEADREGIEFFEKKIRPVLVEHCYECHSAGAKQVEGALLLDSKTGALKGGEQGPAVVPGDLDKSLLLRAIRYVDKDVQMPPAPKERLPAEVIADFEAWIKRGAPDPRDEPAVTSAYHVDIEERKGKWPFTAPVDPPIPAVKQADWPRNPIDHFILAKLEEKGIAPLADADKRTLIRRVTIDLTGLPPTVEEVDRLLSPSPTRPLSPSGPSEGERGRVGEWEKRYAGYVEQLLASPHYGERQGRHWLDVVRYADTAGDNSDYPIPQMYRYRNWVINAFNADMPYDEFIRQQIAGDLLPADSVAASHEQIVATGYIALARRFGSTVDDYPTHLTIEDTIDNLGRTFLGLTINCARCHNHKFDPVTNEDYYALYGIFHSTRFPWPGIELDKVQRDLVPLTSDEEVAAAKEARKVKLDELTAAVKAVEDEKKSIQKEENGEEKSKRLDEVEKKLRSAKKQREDFEKEPLPYEQAYAVAEGKTIGNCQVQLKGDPTRLGTEVPRRFLQVLGGQALPVEEKGSGRVELANWIASQNNPLTARVMVNRLWQQHFGRGLVATPNDFGKQGQPPTHPELLDWLAMRFIESGWSVKEMQRLMVMSRAYQLASQESGVRGQESVAGGQEPVASADNPKSKIQNPKLLDPANSLLWHHNRRRLDAESIRDTLLMLGGNLDPTMGEGHPFPPQKDWDFTQHKPFKAVYDTNRRSVYLMTQRIQRHPLMATFDGPDTGASTGSRITSTTTLQALYFLNDPLVHAQANRIADRVRNSADNDAGRIDHAYNLLYSRPATEDEQSLAAGYLSKLRSQAGDNPEAAAWQSLIRVLLRTNEYVYVE
ncbi:MAG TPA: DUF1553 domain-containing protein [Pirellulaceae bacterium]|nr:DUF1553 domain-containing protein [Pirellulaceae bacterium]